MKKDLIVIQGGCKECGAACLLSIIRYYGGDASLDRLVDMTKTTKDGTNFYNMSEAITKFNIIAKCYKCDDIDKIKNISLPFIAQINNNNYNHFVVVYKIFDNKIIVMDPSKGRCNLDTFDFFNNWTGNIMLFEKINAIPNYDNEKILNKII